MTEGLPLFDLPRGRELRDEAIAKVEENALEAWKEAAAAAVEELAGEYEFFTSDHVWHRLERDGAPECHEPRAMGAIFQAAARAGLVVPTSDYRQSRRPACHARPIRVWRSLKAVAVSQGAA